MSFLRRKKDLGDDVDIQIRENSINLYYKGASLLLFKWINKNEYRIEISTTFFDPVEPEIHGKYTVLKNKKGISTRRVYAFDDKSIRKIKGNFKAIIKQLKKNIDYVGHGRENTFEQLFIDNNLNPDNDLEFIVLDRQVVISGNRARLDLVALSKIRKSNEYRLNLIEIKYGKDPRIPEVHNGQLKKYYDLFWSEYENVAKVYENIIKQKKAIDRWPDRLKEVKISRDKNTMIKIAVFGNINETHNLLKEAKKQFDEKTYFTVQHNIL